MISPFFQTENSKFHSTALALCRVYSSRRAYIINPHSSLCICLHAFLRNLTLFVNHMTQRKIIAFFRWDIWDTLLLLNFEFLSWEIRMINFYYPSLNSFLHRDRPEKFLLLLQNLKWQNIIENVKKMPFANGNCFAICPFSVFCQS